MEINDLHKVFLNFQEMEYATANGREATRMLSNLIAWERDCPGRGGVRLAPRSGKKETLRDVFGGTPNPATGTVAPPKIGVNPLPIAVAVCLPRN